MRRPGRARCRARRRRRDRGRAAGRPPPRWGCGARGRRARAARRRAAPPRAASPGCGGPGAGGSGRRPAEVRRLRLVGQAVRLRQRHRVGPADDVGPAEQAAGLEDRRAKPAAARRRRPGPPSRRRPSRPRWAAPGRRDGRGTPPRRPAPRPAPSRPGPWRCAGPASPRRRRAARRAGPTSRGRGPPRPSAARARTSASSSSGSGGRDAEVDGAAAERGSEPAAVGGAPEQSRRRARPVRSVEGDRSSLPRISSSIAGSPFGSGRFAAGRARGAACGTGPADRKDLAP
jgi:hypothetical protein